MFFPEEARKKKGRKAQIRYVNDFLVKRITYGKGTRHYGDAFGALVQRRALCTGYARAFALVMNELGIENAFESTSDHIWNRVRIRTIMEDRRRDMERRNAF